jgi:hypothetical protein
MENLGHITTVVAILAALVSVAIVLLICVVRAYMDVIMNEETDEQ